MGIYAEKTNDSFLVEPGTYVARCVSMIEIGTVEVDWNGNTKRVHKVNIGWELPTEIMPPEAGKGEVPYMISSDFNLSMHEKAKLRQMLEGWRGTKLTEDEARKFDVTTVLGKSCMITVVHEPGKADPSKLYAKIAHVSKLMKNQTCPAQINPTKLLCYENFDWALFASLPDYMKDKIRQSVEYKKLPKEDGNALLDGPDEEPAF